MKNQNPEGTAAWEALQKHYEELRGLRLQDVFKKNPDRAKELVIEWQDFFFDYSKNLITSETRDLLLQLAEQAGLQGAIEDYFAGAPINKTEGRAVLHTALRAPAGAVDRYDPAMLSEVAQVKQKIRLFSEEIISGSRKGYTGEPFTDVVNIGIGGSDLGPVMVTEALAYYRNHLKLHFVSNVDGDHVHEVLKDLNPQTTLFIVVSKSFSTQETLANATTIRNWFLKKIPAEAVSQHFVAVSSNVSAVSDFGIAKENIFPMWDWVGGRFSLWSAVGLSIALGVGYEHFEELLEGAYEMDEHFRLTQWKDNIPVQLALLSIWYNNFHRAQTKAIIPYTQYLHRLPAYLQQAIMESNGKGTDRNGDRVQYQTGNIVWGEPGTNSQHAFFQLIHQGTKLIPADFIGFVEPLHQDWDHHHKLMANFFAQTEALLQGKSRDAVVAEFENRKVEEQQYRPIVPFKEFEGNKPTTTILIKKLTPASLGKLIAMYEHEIFVQGVIWNIYSYDQWGVELGKELASTILQEIKNGKAKQHDSSTARLLNFYRSSSS